MKVSQLVSASAAALVLLASAATPAAAHGPIRFIITYYSELDPSEQVGQFIFYCDGHSTFTGTQGTSNSFQEDFTCP